MPVYRSMANSWAQVSHLSASCTIESDIESSGSSFDIKLLSLALSLVPSSTVSRSFCTLSKWLRQSQCISEGSASSSTTISKSTLIPLEAGTIVGCAHALSKGEEEDEEEAEEGRKRAGEGEGGKREGEQEEESEKEQEEEEGGVGMCTTPELAPKTIPLSTSASSALSSESTIKTSEGT